MLVLLFGAIGPAARLSLPEPVTCGMVCCEESGVCHCHTHHTGDSEETGAAARPEARTYKLGAAKINRSCPAQCAQLPASFQKHSIARAQPLRFTSVTGAARRSFIHAPFLARDTLIAEAHAPRAPPATLL
jgi:hypothetical protein